MFPTGTPASVRASFSSDGNAPPQSGKTPCTLQEAFVLRDSVLAAAGPVDFDNVSRGGNDIRGARDVTFRNLYINGQLVK